MTVMPMFPLGSLLFPNMPLNLRIFEERYLKLLGDLMGTENPEFGVVGIARGMEVGGGEGRMSIGTIATVTEIGTTGEFLGLESFGSQRFRVNAWLPDDPYPVADIELIPVHIDNLNRVLPRGEFLPVPLLSCISFGPPMWLERGETKVDFLDRARRAVLALKE
jgi:Lon protease-like protein